LYCSSLEVKELAKKWNSKQKTAFKEWLEEVHLYALEEARKAGFKAFMFHGDKSSIGFAWINSYEKGNTFLGKAIAGLGFSRSWNGGYCLWNPSGLGFQSVYILEAGSWKYKEVLQEYLPGIELSTGSRLD
jgi:hypothetical protein